jgi:hypothetical protein
MSYPIYIGSTAETAQGMRFLYTPGDGETAEYKWEGPASAVLAKYLSNCTAQTGSAYTYDQVDFRDENGKGVLIARQAASSVNSLGGTGITEVWELYGMEVTRPVETHPRFNAITPARVVEIKAGIGMSPPWSKAFLNIAASSEEEKLYDLLAKGATDYNATAFLLRKTETTSSRGTVTASVAGIGYVYTATAIAPPSTFRAAIGSIQGNDGTATGLPGDWLKRPSQVRQIGPGKYQIITEWLWAVRWSAILYNGGSGTP